MWKHAVDKVGRSALHYDHAEDGTYLGFSHRVCNLRAGAAKGGRIAVAKRKPAPRFDKQCARCGETFKAWTENQTRCSYACRVAGRPKKPAVQLELRLGKPTQPPKPPRLRCACGQLAAPPYRLQRCERCLESQRARRLSLIRPLVDQGLSNEAIAQRTGIPVGSVGHLAKLIRRVE